MNIFLQFANEVFKASQKLENAIKADFNTPELLETNKPKDDRDGDIWKFGQLGEVLSEITPRSGDGPITDLKSECLAVCMEGNLTKLSELIENLADVFQQVVDEYKYSWEEEEEEEELCIPSLFELNRQLVEFRRTAKLIRLEPANSTPTKETKTAGRHSGIDLSHEEQDAIWMRWRDYLGSKDEFCQDDLELYGRPKAETLRIIKNAQQRYYDRSKKR